MGHATYSVSSRVARATTDGYHTKSTDQIFEQNKKRQIHESMEPKKATIREARDSAAHPNSVPIIIALDVTGSMRQVPHELIKDGLPTMVGSVVQAGIADPSILFLAIGDHEVDNYPLQVGQFESGDAELDMWLTRTYLEGGGGGNAGESYLLSWYFAAQHTVTDAWDKRQQKGFLFTIGDEPGLKNLPKAAIAELLPGAEASFTDVELLAKAQERYNVYHIHVSHGGTGYDRAIDYWKNILGQNVIVIKDHQEVAKTIANLVVNNSEKAVSATPKTEEKTEKTEDKPEIML